MEFSSFKLFRICFLLQSLVFAQNVTFECHYEQEKVNYVSFCYIQKDPQVKSPHLTLVNVTGNELKGYSHYNIEVFYIKNRHMNFFPRDFSSFFVNIMNLTVVNCGLLEIKPKDLEKFNRLFYIDLSDNKLKSIEANTFIFNKNLPYHLDLHSNKIKFVQPAWINNNSNLSFLDFSKNDCIADGKRSHRVEVENLIMEITQKCRGEDASELKEPERKNSSARLQRASENKTKRESSNEKMSQSLDDLPSGLKKLEDIATTNTETLNALINSIKNDLSLKVEYLTKNFNISNKMLENLNTTVYQIETAREEKAMKINFVSIINDHGNKLTKIEKKLNQLEGKIDQIVPSISKSLDEVLKEVKAKISTNEDLINQTVTEILEFLKNEIKITQKSNETSENNEIPKDKVRKF